MKLSFLPLKISFALDNLNYNYLSEIRLRNGQPVIVEYQGQYRYLTATGVSDDKTNVIIASDIYSILNGATGGCIYKYAEQIKNGFITVEHGVRIGIAGEYVTQNGTINAINNITSLNIRIPHKIDGCAEFVIKNIFFNGLHSTLLYSKPGLGKTTLLRGIACELNDVNKNILIFDERNEIAAIDAHGNGFDLGENIDVVRYGGKLTAISSAIRAMKPDVIITDELYGENDFKAVRYCIDCGICVIASTHVTDKTVLSKMPFEFFVHLTNIGERPIIYDKNFVAYSCNRTDGFCGSTSFDRKKEENAGIF